MSYCDTTETWHSAWSEEGVSVSHEGLVYSSELSCSSFSGLICIPHTEERIGDDGALELECDGDNSSTFNQDSDAMLRHSLSHCKYMY